MRGKTPSRGKTPMARIYLPTYKYLTLDTVTGKRRGVVVILTKTVGVFLKYLIQLLNRISIGRR